MNDSLRNYFERMSDIVGSISKVFIALSLIGFSVVILVADVYLGYLFYADGVVPILAIAMEAAPQVFADFVNFFFIVKKKQGVAMTIGQTVIVAVAITVWAADALKDAYKAYLFVQGGNDVLVMMTTTMALIVSAFGEATLLYLPSLIKMLVEGYDDESS